MPPEARFVTSRSPCSTETGEKILVTTYAANPIGKFKPKAHYLDWVMKGLKHWKFPQEVIEQWDAYRPRHADGEEAQSRINVKRDFKFQIEEPMPKPKYHIVVCTNARPPGHPKPSCGSAGSAQLLMAFNMGLMQRGVMPGDVLVSGSSCLGPCEQGPTVVVYPEGTWYSKVTEADVATILDEHIKGGKPAAKLNPDAVWK